MRARKPCLRVTVFSDYICPFCYIGDRRLAWLSGKYHLEVDWRFLGIHPDTPSGGCRVRSPGERRLWMTASTSRMASREKIPPRPDGPRPAFRAGYFASFAAMVATCLPWKRAASSSFPLGILSPLAPAMVVAPYGEPPVISSMRICPWKAYGSPTTTIP